MNEYTQLREEEENNRMIIWYENILYPNITKKSTYKREHDSVPYVIQFDKYVIRNYEIYISYKENGQIAYIQYLDTITYIDDVYKYRENGIFRYIQLSGNRGKYYYICTYYINSTNKKEEKLCYYKYNLFERIDLNIHFGDNPICTKITNYDEQGNITNTTYDGQYIEGIDDAEIPEVPENYNDLDVYIS